MSDFMKAAGVIPWEEGDELPEDVIRRLRNGTVEHAELTIFFMDLLDKADRRGRLLEAH